MNKCDLDKFRVFQRISPEELAMVTKISEEISVPDGEVIFKEGDRSEYLFCICGGRVSLRVTVPNGKVYAIATVEPGEELGWSAVRRNCPYTATSIATGTVTAIRIPGRELVQIFESEPRMGCLVYAGLLGVVAERLDEARIRIANIVHS